MRLCFLINHIHSANKKTTTEHPPIVIVGNKKDLQFDRMVSTDDGEKLSKALKHPYFEISTRDSYEETATVFNTLYCEMQRQGCLSPATFKKRNASKLMEKIPKIYANSTLIANGRSLSFNSFQNLIPEWQKKKSMRASYIAQVYQPLVMKRSLLACSIVLKRICLKFSVEV